MPLTKIISSIQILIVCTSCKMSCNVLSHSHWGLGQFFFFLGGGSLKFWGGGVKKRQSPDFRSPEVGISATMSNGGNLLMPIHHLVVYWWIRNDDDDDDGGGGGGDFDDDEKCALKMLKFS